MIISKEGEKKKQGFCKKKKKMQMLLNLLVNK